MILVRLHVSHCSVLKCKKETMSNQSVQTLKGFRDFLPAEKRRRDFVASKLQAAFQRFGFEPLETPTLEYASLLLGKYGEEADKLVYTFEDRGERRIGLRYDQTVPTARVLGQYQNELPRYFRRYQMQNVFRADKPQKGRFREFAQCDCDIFGSTSPVADAEILAVFYAGFREVGFGSFRIELNDRQTLLAALSPFATDQVTVASIIQSIDKLDKMTADEVVTELVTKGLAETAARSALSAIQTSAPSENLREIMTNAQALGVPNEVLVFNPTLARGLDYYTGMIFEGKILEYPIGSVGGGGRYDNLIGDLTGQSMPAVGFGIGFDRTVEAAQELGLIPDTTTGTQVLVTVMDESTLEYSLGVATQLRQAGVRVEVYPELDKLGKQFKLADQKQIPWVVIAGGDEMAAGKVTVKNMGTGEQQLLELSNLIASLG